MTVRSILESKGRNVISINPDISIMEATAMLALYRIGALVVCGEGKSIKGLFSERDIVYAVAAHGTKALERKVSEFMSSKVYVCYEHYTVNQAMGIMNQHRFRHLPVECEGRLHGIISVGDVVKRRIEEVEREAEAIRSYIATA